MRTFIVRCRVDGQDVSEPVDADEVKVYSGDLIFGVYNGKETEQKFADGRTDIIKHTNTCAYFKGASWDYFVEMFKEEL